MSERVVDLQEELKKDWSEGRRTRVEDLLTRQSRSDISPDDVLDLLYQEMILREEAGEKTVLEEYVRRFPDLQTDLKSLFSLLSILREDAFATHPYSTVVTEADVHSSREPGREGFSTPSRIGQFRLERKLGAGAMGQVLLAWDERLRRSVALKMLRPGAPMSHEALVRFRREAELLAQLNHPHIVQIFEVGEYDEAPFFAMEYVAGVTLAQRIAEGVLEPRAAAELVRALAGAVSFAHERGIIHRDLKPSNVLLAEDARAKISDFGLARRGGPSSSATGDVIGTPSYMAPEQALGQQDRVGPAADVYGLGAILYEAVTGRAPFRAANVPATLHQVVHDDPVPPRRLQPETPRDLETIILKCLHKDPGRRYRSAQMLVDDLDRFLRGEPVLARPIGFVDRFLKWTRREPKVASLAAVLVLSTLVGFAVVMALWQGERRERQHKEEQLYFNRVALADREIAAGKVLWARALLEECPEPLRGWEWHHLMHRCRTGTPRPIATPGKVGTLAAHPNAPRVVLGCDDGNLLTFDGDRLVGPPLPAHLGSVNWVAFSSDGGEVYSGGEDGRVCVWDSTSNERTFLFTAHQGPITCIAIHPREPWVASTTSEGPDEGSVLLWDRRTGKTLHVLENHSARVMGLAFHPTGRLLASASHDRTITLWDCHTGKVVHVLTDHRSPIACLTFSPDGKWLASAAGRLQNDGPQDDEVFVWDMAKRRVRHRLRGHEKRVVALVFSANGDRLATAGLDGFAKLWEPLRGQEILTLSGHRDRISALGFDRSETLITGSEDGSALVWQAPR